MIFKNIFKSIYKIFKNNNNAGIKKEELNNIDKNNTKYNIKNNLSSESSENTNIQINKEKIMTNKLLYNNEEKTKENIKTINVTELKKELNTIWDILKVKENTQAEHLIKSIPSDRWVNMDEIRQRIKLEFNIEYKNDKSLYPYLKTLTDINLIKINNTGKKRSWKKNVILIEK